MYIEFSLIRMKKRNTDIDFCKGVLILIVIWGHVCPNSSGSEYTYTWCALARITSLFAMPLFFLLSGFFAKSIKSFKDIIKQIHKVFWRLGVPLLTYGFIVSCIKYHIFDNSYDFYEFCYCLKKALLYILGFYWYISALLICIGFGAIISYIRNKTSQTIGVTISILTIIFIPCIPSDVFHFTFVWPFYMLGMLMSQTKTINQVFNRLLRLPLTYLLPLSFLCIYFGYNFYPEKTFYFFSYNPLKGGVIVIWRFALYLTATIQAFILLEKMYNKSHNFITKFISKAGKETLFIYMSHMVLLFYIYKPIVLSLTDSVGILPTHSIIRYYIYSPIISLFLFYFLFKLSIQIKKCTVLNILLNGNYTSINKCL